MAIFSHYGTGQRLGFLIVSIGFSLCLIGSIAPFWITAQTSIKFLFDELDLKLFDVNAGIWYYCVDYRFEKECRSMYDPNDYKGPLDNKDRFAWINVVRFAVVINILLSLISGLIACCRCLCCSGGRTVCHGILSFFAGAFGCAAVWIVYSKTKSLLNIPIIDVDYQWAGAIYALGSVLLIIASFILCCALPRESGYGLVVAQPVTPGISVNVSNSNSNTVNQYSANQYNTGGQIQHFEPLPTIPAPVPYGQHAQTHYPPTDYNPQGYNNNLGAAVPLPPPKYSK